MSGSICKWIKEPKVRRALTAILVFVIVLTVLYLIRPIRLPNYDAGGRDGFIDLEQGKVLEQPFYTIETCTDVTFMIGTHYETIETGSLIVRITDETGELINETVFPAEQLTDNAKLTIQTDLPPGDYTISFSLADSNEQKRFSIYMAAVRDLPRCSYDGKTSGRSVFLELTSVIPVETIRSRYISVFRLSSILTVAAVFLSIAVTAAVRKKQGRLDKRAIIRPVFAIAALIIIAVILYRAFNETVMSGGTAFLRSSREMFYLILILLAVFIYLLAEDYPFSAYLLLFCVGLTLIFTDYAYSVIDEGAHTEITQYVIQHHRFPTIYQNYEAVQGPVYYFVLALLSGWLPYQYVYLAGRIFGLICLVLFGWISGKTVKMIAERKAIRVPKGLLNVSILVFIMNPHILIRFTRVSNEALMSVLAAFAIHEATRLILDGYNGKQVTLCTVLCAIAFLTKSTSVFVFGLVFLVCAYYHQWRAFFLQAGLYLLLLAPWFINNYRIYGRLTAMQGHLEFVLPIVNPDMTVPDIWQSLINFFGRYFCHGECGNWYDYPILDGFLNPLCLLLLEVALIISLGWLGGFIRKKLRFTYDLQERQKVLFLSFTALPVVSMIMHSVQTLMTLNNSIEQNRYVLMLNGAFCCMLLFGLSRYSEKAKKGFTILICVFYAFFSLSLICGYTETIIGRI